MTSSTSFVHTSQSRLLEYVVTHVFLPVHLPENSDCTAENNHALARAVCAAAHAFAKYVCGTSEQAQWHRVAKMLDNLQASVQSEQLDCNHTVSRLQGMEAGDILVFYLRYQNAAIVFTKGDNYTICEAFEASPSSDTVTKTPGPLTCSYPGSAVEMPNAIFHDGGFQLELAKFLSRSGDADSSDPSLPLPNHPHYTGTLLSSILQSAGHIADISRVPERAALLKRIRDHVGWSLKSGLPVKDPWRRSPLWLLIRVAIQMSVSYDLGRVFYKQFVLFFTCTLAQDENNASLSSDLLHLMSSRILRRLSKLGPSTPDWLSDTALKTSACLREILDNRWKPLTVRRSPFRNPSQDELARDTRTSLLNSDEYIRNALADPVPKRLPTLFRPSHHRRGTIDDFLSSNGTFFDEAYDADPDTTLYDVERSVEQGIDDWLARVANVDEACAQLETLMDKYMMKAYDWDISNPEDRSNVLLTGIELYVALDKLVIQEIPLLADYPPEIPIALLERLFLRNSTSLHRLACAYQYLTVRHSRSRLGWSVLSNDFTEESFPIRYYNQSPHLQRLKARIEEDAMIRASGHAGMEQGGDRPTCTHDEYQGLAEKTETSSPLPALSLHGKAVVFELGCPPCFLILRSAAPRILDSFDFDIFTEEARNGREGFDLLARVPALQPYHVERQGPSLHWQTHLAYAYVHPSGSKSRNTNPVLCYAIQHPTTGSGSSVLSVWRPERHYVDEKTRCDVNSYPPFSKTLEKYHYASHTSNDIMAAQADCPADLSLDEFVAFAHLRNPRSLQWLNILHGLRSRTLNLHDWNFQSLLAYASLEVGPLDLTTGTWIWHQELQESSFCDGLLDELDSLFMDVGTISIDDVLMGTISLLLTRVLASSPSADISERAITLLRKVRRKTFSWMQVLSYDMAKAPTNSTRRDLLRKVAFACRSTFDVDPATLRKLLHSAEDVDALFSCTFFIHALSSPPPHSDHNLNLYLSPDNQYRRLSLASADILKDVILTDASDYGVDLAVSKIFPIYRPGTCRWEQWQNPNNHWITCNTEETVSQPSQTLHVSLHDGMLRVNGQLLGGLPHDVERLPQFHEIFRDQGFWVIPSNLPGMDFTTFNTSSTHKVHFSLRDGNLVLRAQCNQSNEILQLIPSEKLEGDLPPALIDGYVHWLNLSTKVVEIRPFKQLWEESPEHWRIECASRGYRVYKGCETLVDIRSPTWAMVFMCFECINDVDIHEPLLFQKSFHRQLKQQSKNILITTSPIDSVHFPLVQRLSVALPRYNLSFFVNDGEELECRDFGGMVYDENQSIGTLFGLENLLVLRPKSHIAMGVIIPETLIHRRVIIPSGHLTKRGDHRVQVHVEQTSHELYHTYEVDAELGCLIGNGSLSNTAFLAHLHVMTSHHRPDPLMGKTGAQAALCLLQSAVCRSVMKPNTVDHEDIERFAIFTQYPQVNAAYQTIRNRFHYGRHSYISGYSTVLERHAAARAAYLFPFHENGPALPGDCDCNDRNYTMHVSAQPGPPTLSQTVSSLRYVFNLGSPTQITLNSLICNRPVPDLPAHSNLLRDSYTTSSNDLTKLEQLFYSLRPVLRYQQEYIAHLQTSAQHASTERQTTHRVTGGNLIKALKKHYEQCRVTYLKSLDILIKSLGPTTDPHEQALDQFGQWPPVTADVLLRYLASTSPISIPPCWKRCLTSFALLLLGLQRGRRLVRFALDGLEEEFSKELENEGCDGWSAEEYPDWLLIQIQGNFLIRRTQAETIMELISPQSGGNTVMQVNMGEGKSSVIIPIAASALADGKQLVRVVVPKALAVQMFELLASRLGGLTNRPIYYLPFCRTPKYDHRTGIDGLRIGDILRVVSQCMTERGIVLLQPEHVASLKLTAVEQQIREGAFMADLSMKLRPSIYKSMKAVVSLRPVQIVHHDGHDGNAHGASDVSKWLSLQELLYSHARDILDENDQILHTRFQLVYTVGNPQHMDGYPHRWTITQQVLKLVKKHIYFLSRYAPDSVECKQGPPGSFPHVRILRASDVGPRLISLIVEDVMFGWIPGFDFRSVSSALQNAIRSFISDEDVLQIPDTAKRVEEYAKNYNQNLWNGLLQLRGLLTSNILLLVLTERRWRVDYGRSLWMPLHPKVTDLAVPYRTKDVPFPNTQFGHPDITIILTCLCYYYTGLKPWELRRTFKILLNQDDPFAEYALWIEEYDRESVPDSLQKLSNINFGWEQWDNVTSPYFAHNRATIDFYLSRVVFPKEAKEYPWKLSASSWDLAEKREKPITGMSGTSDERWLLPMSIAQRDLDHQKGIDARVLAYLLQPENDFYMVTHEIGNQWSTRAFLRMVVTQLPEIRVLLDVGSQIIDLSNREVADAWLGIASEAAGAIYFNEGDELRVLARNGISQLAQSSPLFQQLDRCIVYLDHAHTRGTDIKFPIGSRAAVTLGPKVTKDAVVQGCMRMRKLGHGHSVMFFAPPDVDRNIRATVAKMDPDSRVTTVDVLCWAIHETWTNIQHRAPHWAQQGMDHRMRSDAWFSFASGKLTQEKLADAWLQPELKSLANLYAPCETKTMSSLSVLDSDIRQRCKDLGILSLPKAQMEEEQEREICREHEREREVELPPKAEPAQHFLHPDVVSFVRTGVIPPLHSGSAFQPIFTTLEKSSAATDEADVWSPFILATTDFYRTIKPESTRGTVDQYLRPVQWILSSNRNHDQMLVLLSQFEADHLMPDIRASEHVHLHLYAPRTTQRMKPSDDLKLYSIPPLPANWTPPWTLVDQLNVFAGQLYLRDYQTYLRLCRFLGVPTKESPDDPGAIQRNLFNIPGGFEEVEITFSGSPLPFVMALLAMRSRGTPFAHTHMGKILQGQVLTEKDF